MGARRGGAEILAARSLGQASPFIHFIHGPATSSVGVWDAPVGIYWEHGIKIRVL